MKKEFPGYYHPTKEEFKKIWGACEFLFDTNILLNLYQYSEDTKITLISIFEDIDDRIWIPYQVGLEYHRRRVDVITKIENAYDKIEGILSETFNEIKSTMENECKSGRHPLIDCGEFIDELSSLIEKYKDQLEDKKQKHPDLLIDDPIKEKLSELFKDHVCERLNNEKMEKVLTEGKERYKEKIPPGYKDSNKSGLEKYGDLIIWFEVIEHARKRKRPIIFVTDDSKEDWWYIAHGRTIGPRPELISEIQEKSDIKFYMYSSDRFMKYAEEFLRSNVEQKAIDEAREIRLQEEKQDDIHGSLLGTAALDIPDPYTAGLAGKLSELARQIYPSTDISRFADEIAKQAYPSTDMSHFYDEIARQAYPSTDMSHFYDEIARHAYPSTDIGNIASIAQRAFASIEEIYRRKKSHEKNIIEEDEKKSTDLNHSNDENKEQDVEG